MKALLGVLLQARIIHERTTEFGAVCPAQIGEGFVPAILVLIR